MGHVRGARYRSLRAVAISALLRIRPLLQLGCLGACRHKLRLGVGQFTAAFGPSPLRNSSLDTLVPRLRVAHRRSMGLRHRLPQTVRIAGALLAFVWPCADSAALPIDAFEQHWRPAIFFH